MAKTPTTATEALDAWTKATGRDDLVTLRQLANESAEMLNFDEEDVKMINAHLDIRDAEKA